MYNNDSEQIINNNFPKLTSIYILYIITTMRYSTLIISKKMIEKLFIVVNNFIRLTYLYIFIIKIDL